MKGWARFVISLINTVERLYFANEMFAPCLCMHITDVYTHNFYHIDLEPLHQIDMSVNEAQATAKLRVRLFVCVLGTNI